MMNFELALCAFVHVNVRVLIFWPQGPLVWLPLNGRTAGIIGIDKWSVGKNERSVHEHEHVYVHVYKDQLTALMEFLV